jgi:hypothetical protein
MSKTTLHIRSKCHFYNKLYFGKNKKYNLLATSSKKQSQSFLVFKSLRNSQKTLTEKNVNKVNTIVVTSAIIYTIAEKRKEATNDDSLQLQSNRVNG